MIGTADSVSVHRTVIGARIARQPGIAPGGRNRQIPPGEIVIGIPQISLVNAWFDLPRRSLALEDRVLKVQQFWTELVRPVG